MSLLTHPPDDSSDQDIPEELHLETPRRKYDLNFAAGRVRQVWSNEVFLQPFIPSEHARALARLFKQYPQVNQYRFQHTSGSLRELLEFAEHVRKDESACLWCVFQFDDSSTWDLEPRIQSLIGIIGLSSFDARTLTIDCGYEVIFPPYQRLNFASHASSLMQTYVFTELRLVCLSAGCHKENHAVIKLAQRIGFRQEVLRTGCLGWGAPDNKDPPDGVDPRTVLNYVTAVRASMTWQEWEKGSGRWFSEAIKANVTSPTRFTNSLEGAVPKQENGKMGLGMRLLNLGNVGAKYEHNFVGPFRDLVGTHVLLTPLVPSSHARTISTLGKRHPEALDIIEFHELLRARPNIEHTLDGLLKYFEYNRRDQTILNWAIFERKEGEVKDVLVGFAVLHAHERGLRAADPKSSTLGPIVIFPNAQDIDVIATETMTLIQSFVFNPSPGLSHVRLSLHLPPSSPAITAAKSAGFLESGISRHWVGPEGVEGMPWGERKKAQQEGNDVRMEFGLVQAWLGEVIWWDWVKRNPAVGGAELVASGSGRAEEA